MRPPVAGMAAYQVGRSSHRESPRHHRYGRPHRVDGDPWRRPLPLRKPAGTRRWLKKLPRVSFPDSFFDCNRRTIRATVGGECFRYAVTPQQRCTSEVLVGSPAPSVGSHANGAPRGKAELNGCGSPIDENGAIAVENAQFQTSGGKQYHLPLSGDCATCTVSRSN